ncbi:MAG: HAD family hydrolase [Flavobacteriales bacterium]
MSIKINQNTVVVFDLDDTLYKEIDFLKSAFREIARSVDLKQSTELFLKMFSKYRNKENAFDFVSTIYRVDKKSLIEKYRSHVPQIELSLGAFDLIKSIRDKGGKMAIITDGRKITQMNKVKQLNIVDFFEMICISEEIGAEKPNQDAFLLVENNFGSEFNYIYIGDNMKKDFIAPNKLGWESVYLEDNGLNIHNNNFDYIDVELNKPTYIIKSLTELICND